MAHSFSEIMSELRRERGLSQRAAAAELHISQALLSHYENGAREPGLDFVCRACRYYNVSADYLLGLSKDRRGGPDRQALNETLTQLEALTERFRAAMKEDDQ